MSAPAPTRYLPAWQTGELPEPPVFGWRRWTLLIGPGLMMVGANIGGGEWLFGPVVTAQYGGRIMWLATLSITMQVFYNLAVMRYALYSGEPIFVGFFRTPPGPVLWVFFYFLPIWAASGLIFPLTPPFRWPLPYWDACPPRLTTL